MSEEKKTLNNEELQSTDECVELKEDQLEKVAGGKIWAGYWWMSVYERRKNGAN